MALAAALTATASCGASSTTPAPAGPGPSSEPDLRSCADLSRDGKNDNNCVRTLQRLLNHRGANLPVEGIFGEHTYDRVRQFQQVRGLSETGLVDEGTKEELDKYPMEDEEWDLRTHCVDLLQDSQGPCVLSLQRLLTQHGAKVSDTGKYDQQTVEAVRQFQSEHNLQASGATDSATKNELYDPRNSQRAEVNEECPDSECKVLNYDTVTEIADFFDTSPLFQGPLRIAKDTSIGVACTWPFKATVLRVLCGAIIPWTIDFIAEFFREARDNQKCIKISFRGKPEDAIQQIEC